MGPPIRAVQVPSSEFLPPVLSAAYLKAISRQDIGCSFMQECSGDLQCSLLTIAATVHCLLLVLRVRRPFLSWLLSLGPAEWIEACSTRSHTRQRSLQQLRSRRQVHRTCCSSLFPLPSLACSMQVGTGRWALFNEVEREQLYRW